MKTVNNLFRSKKNSSTHFPTTSVIDKVFTPMRKVTWSELKVLLGDVGLSNELSGTVGQAISKGRQTPRNK